MMLTLQEWLATPEIVAMKKMPIDELINLRLHRSPMRPIHIDHRFFLSPADGIILYSRVVNADEDIIPLKGEEYTVNEILREEFHRSCLVIGIFMTVSDVHENRIPTDGYITYKKLPPLKVMNLSMREIERDITERLCVDYSHLNYALYNERVVNRVFHNPLKQPYYIVQIADYEVDVIAHFDESQNKYYTSGERFSLVRMGSQVDLIIPFINPEIIFKSLVDDKVMWHVEAGIDRLVQVIQRKGGLR
jgi:phosphatidylserine decarboxylase